MEVLGQRLHELKFLIHNAKFPFRNVASVSAPLIWSELGSFFIFSPTLNVTGFFNFCQTYRIKISFDFHFLNYVWCLSFFMFTSNCTYFCELFSLIGYLSFCPVLKIDAIFFLIDLYRFFEKGTGFVFPVASRLFHKEHFLPVSHFSEFNFTFVYKFLILIWLPLKLDCEVICSGYAITNSLACVAAVFPFIE